MAHEANHQKIEALRPDEVDDGRNRMARKEMAFDRYPRQSRELLGALDDRHEAMFGFLSLLFNLVDRAGKIGDLFDTDHVQFAAIFFGNVDRALQGGKSTRRPVIRDKYLPEHRVFSF